MPTGDAQENIDEIFINYYFIPLNAKDSNTIVKAFKTTNVITVCVRVGRGCHAIKTV